MNSGGISYDKCNTFGLTIVLASTTAERIISTIHTELSSSSYNIYNHGLCLTNQDKKYEIVKEGKRQ